VPNPDPELRDSYQRYAALLETILTPLQRDAYAALIQQTGVVRVFEALTPDELAALAPDAAATAAAIIADETATLENRRVASLLNQHGEHTVAPDLGAPAPYEPSHAAELDV